MSKDTTRRPAGIPSDPAARAAWLSELRDECLCHRSRAIVDLIATAIDAFEMCDTDGERIRATKAIGELFSRMSMADRHQESLEIVELRKRSALQAELADRLSGLH